MKEGDNLLAIQGVNRNLGSSDFLILAELIASEEPFAGNVSADAIKYSSPIDLTQSAHIKARTFYDGEWSALREDYFILPDNYQDLKITEIHYNPLYEVGQDSRDFEFIEIKNTGTSTLNLKGTQFTKGISYKFDSNSFIEPGGFIVLANSPTNFYSRYHFWPSHQFEGNLDNNGEIIEFIDAYDNIIFSLTYNGVNGWPIEPKIDGYSLVPTDFNPSTNQTDYIDWRASMEIGGSPGRDDYITVSIPEIITPLTQSWLSQNYPNPFKEFTYIDYQLDRESIVDLSVFNMMGQFVTKLANGNQAAGLYQVQWNRTNYSSERVPPGIYFYRLSIREERSLQVLTNRMLIVD